MYAPLSAPSRATSAYPAYTAPTNASQRESPSPTKKRRVEESRNLHAGPSRTPGHAQKPHSYHSSPSTFRTSTHAPVEIEADPTDPELQSRLHSSTLKLRDAWDDILRRHSLPAPSPPFSRGASAPVASPAAQQRRHRAPGRTRAIPVEEDDIIDLATMEIVQDRGVLRRSRAGAFALGGYTDALDDVLVGPDTGVGEDEAGAAGASWVDEDEDEPDAWAAEEEEGYTSSEDELADMDELPSLPSLLFREQRRRDAEQRDQLRDFWAHEVRARGVSEADGLLAPAETTTAAGGNRTVPAVQPPDDDDELGFFAPGASPSPSSPAASTAVRRRASSSPLRVTASTPSGKSACRPPPFTTSAVRKSVQAFSLVSSSPARPPASSPSVMQWQRSTGSAPPKSCSSGTAPPKAHSGGVLAQSRPTTMAPSSPSPLKPGSACLNCRKRKRRCDAIKPVCGPCLKAGVQSDGSDRCVYDGDRSLARAFSASARPPSKGLATPPASFAARRPAALPSTAMSTRPPLSSSPLREVINVASPSPAPESSSPSPSLSPAPPAPRGARREPSRSPSLMLGLPLARAISPELGLPASTTLVHAPVQPQPQTYQHPTPTPTPTPPPFSLPGLHAAASGCGSRGPQPQQLQQRTREWRRHPFELVLDIKPRVLPNLRVQAREEGLPPNGTAPSLCGPEPSSAGGEAHAPKPEEDGVVHSSPGGLSTPPLSKRSNRPPASAPAAARRSIAPSAPPSSSASARKALPSRILAIPLGHCPVEGKGSEGEVDDPLLLDSSSSPVERTTGPLARRSMTATPAPVSGGARLRQAVGAASVEDREEEDEFGAW